MDRQLTLNEMREFADRFKAFPQAVDQIRPLLERAITGGGPLTDEEVLFLSFAMNSVACWSAILQIWLAQAGRRDERLAVVSRIITENVIAGVKDGFDKLPHFSID